MLINLSNHPSTKWSPAQLAGFREYAQEITGRNTSSCPIVDEPFPFVDPTLDEGDVQSLAGDFIMAYREQFPDIIAVHLMGETSYVVDMSRMLKAWSVPCLCSTTRREMVEQPDGRKESIFQFVRMRQIG